MRRQAHLDLMVAAEEAAQQVAARLQPCHIALLKLHAKHSSDSLEYDEACDIAWQFYNVLVDFAVPNHGEMLHRGPPTL